MPPKDSNRIGNSDHPDQTLQRSSLIWVCTVCLSKNLGSLTGSYRLMKKLFFFILIFSCIDIHVPIYNSVFLFGILGMGVWPSELGKSAREIWK